MTVNTLGLDESKPAEPMDVLRLVLANQQAILGCGSKACELSRAAANMLHAVLEQAKTGMPFGESDIDVIEDALDQFSNAVAESAVALDSKIDCQRKLDALVNGCLNDKAKEPQ